MTRAGILVLIAVCVLTALYGIGLAKDKEPARPDTASASDIYNPPRVITPDYQAGQNPEVGPGSGGRDTTGVPSPPAPGVRPHKPPCAVCSQGTRPRVGGGGEVVTGLLFADLGDLNRQIGRMGIPTLSEEVLMVGGRGYARIGHLVIGGAGYGGSTESSGVPDCCARSARVEIAYGGVLLGLALSRPRYEVMGGMVFGGGSITVLRERNSRGVQNWYGAWDDFYKDGPDSVATGDLNITSKIQGGFAVLEPFADLKCWVLPFMAVDLTTSYLNATIDRGKWELDGVAIPDSPESNIGGWTIRLGLHFGV
jgi:hypothetical protein